MTIFEFRLVSLSQKTSLMTAKAHIRSNRKQCPPKISQRIKSANLKSQRVSAKVFSENHLFNLKLQPMSP